MANSSVPTIVLPVAGSSAADPLADLQSDIVQVIDELASPQQPYVRVPAVIELLLSRYSKQAYESAGGITAFRKKIINAITNATRKGELVKEGDLLVAPARLVSKASSKASSVSDAGDQQSGDESKVLTPRKRQMQRTMRKVNESGAQQITSVLQEIASASTTAAGTATVKTTVQTTTVKTRIPSATPPAEQQRIKKKPKSMQQQAALLNVSKSNDNSKPTSKQASNKRAAQDAPLRRSRRLSNDLTLEELATKTAETPTETPAESDAEEPEPESEVDAASNLSVNGSDMTANEATTESKLAKMAAVIQEQQDDDDKSTAPAVQDGTPAVEPVSHGDAGAGAKKRTRDEMLSVEPSSDVEDNASVGDAVDSVDDDAASVAASDVTTDTNDIDLDLDEDADDDEEERSRVKRRKEEVRVGDDRRGYRFVPGWIQQAAGKVKDVVGAFYPPWECSFL
ncbi:hypothetical protein RI367_001587 [Sorochytrium milnesiophthora]